MSCNTKTLLAAVIDAVNAQLNNNYVDRDDPRINQGVFTEPTIRGGLMLDEQAKLDFCGYVTECGHREPFGKQWVDRPLYPDTHLVSYEDEGDIKSKWEPVETHDPVIIKVDNVAEMLAYDAPVGARISTGSTTWNRVKITSPSTIADYVPLDSVCGNDFGADPTGLTDSYEALQAMLNASSSRDCHLLKGNYFTSKTLVGSQNSIKGFERNNTVTVKITGEVVPVLICTNVNSLVLNGINYHTTAAMDDEQCVVGLYGCTYYDVSNTRLTCSTNNTTNRKGTGIKTVATDVRFSGYGNFKNISAAYFNIGADCSNTLFKAENMSCNQNNWGMILKGETATLINCDLSGNKEFNIDSHLTLSLIEIGGYTENNFFDTHIKTSVKPRYGFRVIGGKKVLREASGSYLYVNVGDTYGIDVGKAIANDGTLNTVNMLPDPVGALPLLSTDVGFTKDTEDYPVGCTSSMLVTATSSWRRLDPFFVPAGMGTSVRFFVKRVSGTGGASIRLTNTTSGGGLNAPRIELTSSMIPEGEWVNISSTPKDMSPYNVNGITVNYLRVITSGDAVWKIAGMTASVGEYLNGDSYSPFTKELGGTIAAEVVSMPNLPTAKPAKEGQLWNDNGAIKSSGTYSTAKESGPTENRPTSGIGIGHMYYDTTLRQPIYFAGSSGWVDGLGNPLSINSSGATEDRPTSGIEVGYKYFDTTLGKPIYFKSAGVWVDATGAEV